MVSCALLVLSIYGGFQFQSETIRALSVSAALISNQLVELPLNVQLVALLLALFLLARWFLKPTPEP